VETARSSTYTLVVHALLSVATAVLFVIRDAVQCAIPYQAPAHARTCRGDMAGGSRVCSCICSTGRYRMYVCMYVWMYGCMDVCLYGCSTGYCMYVVRAVQ